MGDSTSWVQSLFAGWPMIRANLPTFFIILILMLGAVWWWMGIRYGDLIATKDGQIQLLDRQLAAYRDKLNGATPDQAKAEMEALKEKIRNTVGDKWEPLTISESSKLISAISGLTKRPVFISYSNYLGKDLANSFAETFTKAGWKIESFQAGYTGNGIATGNGKGLPIDLKKAIQSTTNLKVESRQPDLAENLGGVVLFIGIKTN